MSLADLLASRVVENMPAAEYHAVDAPGLKHAAQGALGVPRSRNGCPAQP